MQEKHNTTANTFVSVSVSNFLRSGNIVKGLSVGNMTEYNGIYIAKADGDTHYVAVYQDKIPTVVLLTNVVKDYDYDVNLIGIDLIDFAKKHSLWVE